MLCENCATALSGNRTRFCGTRCQQQKAYDRRVAEWLAGTRKGTIGIRTFRISPFVRRYMIEKAGNRCQKCGWNATHPITGEVPLEIHHIDGDFFNTIEDNLEVVCPNCHSLTETYRGRNKGKGRRR